MSSEYDTIIDLLFDLMKADKEQLVTTVFTIAKEHPEYLLDLNIEKKETSPDRLVDPDFTTTAEYLSDVYYWAKRGQKIKAIKAYRSVFGTGLKESKDAVELIIASSSPYHVK